MSNKIYCLCVSVLAVLVSMAACAKDSSPSASPSDVSAGVPASSEYDGVAGDVDTSDITDESNAVDEDGNAPETVQASYTNPSGSTVESRIRLPQGYVRVSCPEGSFGEFVRTYPLCEDGSEVLLYDGSKKGNQNAHIAVFDMDLVADDLQQCADSVIRIYAEYFRGTKQYEKMQFHFVNGFSCDYAKWKQGMRIKVDGNATAWYQGAESGDSDKAFESYLRMVFCYASTLSLEQESKPVELEQIQIGDIFIHGGSPGHVVMVADICENENKEKAFLLAQGYMPAQQFHVLRNPQHTDNPWYYANELSDVLDTPEYDFVVGELKRPVYGE